ncbi:hypothetical protein BDB01DRAFT_897017 [Pilobolus umbonatus]|nr:hypothetical protein BDB01DRAFT_897017 [Pilobolus umbonatus]
MAQSQYNSIKNIKIKPYQRSNNYIIYPVEIKYVNNYTCIINYSYCEFIQLSRSLHKKFPSLVNNLNYIKKGFNFKPWIKTSNQKYINRQMEIETFCSRLLLLESAITTSDIVLSFFSEMYHQSINKADKSPSPLFIKRTMSLNLSTTKKKFQPWSLHNPSINYPNNPFQSIGRYSPKKHSSLISSTDSSLRSRANSSELFPASIDSDEIACNNYIKIKIVYNIKNIIVIRIPRSITFDDLKSRIIHKFALVNIQLPEDMIFSIIDDSHNSSASMASYSGILGMECMPLIINQIQFNTAMQGWCIKTKFVMGDKRVLTDHMTLLKDATTICVMDHCVLF